MQGHDFGITSDKDKVDIEHEKAMNELVNDSNWKDDGLKGIVEEASDVLWSCNVTHIPCPS